MQTKNLTICEGIIGLIASNYASNFPRVGFFRIVNEYFLLSDFR